MAGSERSAMRYARIAGGLLCSHLTLRSGDYAKQIVETVGMTAAGDGLGGLLYWDPASTATVDSATVFGTGSTGRWLRMPGTSTYPALTHSTIAVATTIVGTTHRWKRIISTGATDADCIFTVQTDAVDPTFLVNDVIFIRWGGVGCPSVAGAGVTFPDTKKRVDLANNDIAIVKVAANTIHVLGQKRV